MDKLTAEEISEFREIFNLVDKDGGGSITKVELADLMDTLGIDASPEEIDAMISEIDQGIASDLYGDEHANLARVELFTCYDGQL